MNTLIPIDYYELIYYNVLLLIVVVIFMQSFKLEVQDVANLKGKNVFGILFLFFLILYIGLRPINYRFGDMLNYYNEFLEYQNGYPFDTSKDFVFEVFKYFFAKNLTAPLFFFTCALLYLLPLYFGAKKIFNDYWFYAFLMLAISFSFWGYGVNGIRNGIASSLFILAISKDKWISKYMLFLLIIFIHKSLIIPILVYFLVSKYSNTKVYLYFWFLTIPLSLAMGGFWENLFLSAGFNDDKLSLYIGGVDQASEGVTLKIGFRWDFLLYSATGIFAAWFFIIKKKFNDKTYSLICNIYIVANGFWILVIRASYSNRFSYLSWFLLGLVIIYPLLKNKFYENQHRKIGIIIILYFGFTYLLNVILAK
ncbi:EpsG family protein [Flavobacterium lacus]|uniref:EpsG-like putative glucosyltransferase n=1 Tax=Flavobacterium lacus TaxID=1353778 RepID=A0A328X0M2_9FLAO|nr:EpsG family protein [Flavobacterium lacus]RAR51135.1 EpsG-like putative glucosyltransferase [Flavobacterium lacus]